eukprot:scpid65289/ scgid33795/ 
MEAWSSDHEPVPVQVEALLTSPLQVEADSDERLVSCSQQRAFAVEPLGTIFVDTLTEYVSKTDPAVRISNHSGKLAMQPSVCNLRQFRILKKTAVTRLKEGQSAVEGERHETTLADNRPAHIAARSICSCSAEAHGGGARHNRQAYHEQNHHSQQGTREHRPSHCCREQEERRSRTAATSQCRHLSFRGLGGRPNLFAAQAKTLVTSVTLGNTTREWRGMSNAVSATVVL